jgi:hypothetical protein
MWRIVTVGLAVLWITGCAPEVARRPTQLTPDGGTGGATIEILQDKPITVGPVYKRVIARGSVWTRVGRIAEGEVYKPVGGVFTVESAHVHEAYLVIEGDRVVGFYLPVERSFSPASSGEDTRLSFQRR